MEFAILTGKTSVVTQKMALISMLERKVSDMQRHLSTAQKQYHRHCRLGNKELAAQYKQSVARKTEIIKAMQNTIMRQKQLVGRK